MSNVIYTVYYIKIHPKTGKSYIGCTNASGKRSEEFCNRLSVLLKGKKKERKPCHICGREMAINRIQPHIRASHPKYVEII